MHTPWPLQSLFGLKPLQLREVFVNYMIYMDNMICLFFLHSKKKSFVHST